MWISITMLMLFSTAAVAQVEICDYAMTSDNGLAITVSCYTDDNGRHIKFKNEAGTFFLDDENAPLVILRLLLTLKKQYYLMVF